MAEPAGEALCSGTGADSAQQLAGAYDIAADLLDQRLAVV